MLFREKELFLHINWHNAVDNMHNRIFCIYIWLVHVAFMEYHDLCSNSRIWWSWGLFQPKWIYDSVQHLEHCQSNIASLTWLGQKCENLFLLELKKKPCPTNNYLNSRKEVQQHLSEIKVKRSFTVVPSISHSKT